MQSSPLSIVVIHLVGGVLLGILAGWLTTLNARPFRFFAEHPWQVFWLCGASTILVLALITSEPARTPPMRIMLFPLLYLSILVFALGAIQGVRVTWLRSWWKAALILLISLVQDFLRMIGSSYPEFKFYAAISLTPSWALAACVTHWVAQRLAAARTVDEI